MNTAIVQAGLVEDHSVGSFTYMREVREQIAKQLPTIAHVFAIRRIGGRGFKIKRMPAPIDVQVSGMELHAGRHDCAKSFGGNLERFPEWPTFIRHKI